MPQDDFELDFVLVRGPSSVDRRLHVRLPRDGTPVTVGRATHCTALLDPSLLFASQVHCSLFAVPVKAGLSPAPARTTRTAEVETPGGAGVASTDAVTPAHQATAPTANAATFTVYVTDMCSSNGTFVNGLRISGTDATELQQGDVCIFGGMRDVEVGEALPADAYEGPELVLWRVDMGFYKESATHDFDFTATPLVLPAEDVLAAEVRALMQTAQRSMPKARQCAADETGGFSVTPAAQRGGGVAVSTTREAASGDSPRGVPQQLFPSSPPPSPDAAVTVARRIDDALASTAGQSEEEEEPASAEGRRRSVSLVAVGVTDVPADPPAAIRYTAVRLGNVAFGAATAAAMLAAAHSKGEKEEGDATPGCKRICRAADAADSLAAVLGGPPLLTCTATHFKWTMPNPSRLLQLQQQQPSEENTADTLPQRLRQPFFGMLPITSVATVLACVVRRGIAVELRDGCELPLVDAAVTTGSAESRWVVWTLSGEEMTEADMPSASSSSGGEQRPTKRARTTRGGRKPAAEKTAVSEKEKGEADVETAAAPADSSSECASPAARFEAWLRHFRFFYESCGVPPAHLVDAATFDLILAPPQSPVTAGPQQNSPA